MVKKIVVFVLFLLFAGKILPHDNSKILCLEFLFINGRPRLVCMTVVNGTLKIHKSTPMQTEGLKYVSLSIGENILYKNILNDPTQGIYEYPIGEGKIGITAIIKDTVDCMLRVPYSTEINKIILSKYDAGQNHYKSSSITSQSDYEFIIDHTKILNRK